MISKLGQNRTGSVRPVGRSFRPGQTAAGGQPNRAAGGGNMAPTSMGRASGSARMAPPVTSSQLGGPPGSQPQPTGTSTQAPSQLFNKTGALFGSANSPGGNQWGGGGGQGGWNQQRSWSQPYSGGGQGSEANPARGGGMLGPREFPGELRPAAPDWWPPVRTEGSAGPAEPSANLQAAMGNRAPGPIRPPMAPSTVAADATGGSQAAGPATIGATGPGAAGIPDDWYNRPFDTQAYGQAQRDELYGQPPPPPAAEAPPPAPDNSAGLRQPPPLWLNEPPREGYGGGYGGGRAAGGYRGGRGGPVKQQRGPQIDPRLT